MNQFKKAKVIMLPTKIKQLGNILWIDSLFSKLQFDNCNYWNSTYHKRVKLFHIYIISDDKIEDGDWYINILQDNTIYRNNIKGYNIDKSYLKKIIATTDTSLNYIKHDDSVPYPKGKQIRLSQPSQQFIEKYIESYNRGEVITDVLVELKSEESYGCDLAYYGLTEPEIEVNQDNTINIKPIKDSWNREEVEELLYNALTSDGKGAYNMGWESDEATNWIEENL